MRLIDADELRKLCSRMMRDPWNDMAAPISWAKAYGDFRDDVDSIPTLTPPNEWVSVYDRLPEPGERVLATDCGFVGEFYINKRGKWQRYNVNCSELLMALDILYWMPLPAPPDCCPPEGEGKPTEPPNV